MCADVNTNITNRTISAVTLLALAARAGPHSIGSAGRHTIEEALNACVGAASGLRVWVRRQAVLCECRLHNPHASV